VEGARIWDTIEVAVTSMEGHVLHPDDDQAVSSEMKAILRRRRFHSDSFFIPEGPILLCLPEDSM
jgi:hypothetical protein